eukprot:g4459.t1
MLKELSLSKEATVEEYLRSYVDHLAKDLQDRVDAHCNAFKMSFEKLKRGEESEEEEKEEKEEEEEKAAASSVQAGPIKRTKRTSRKEDAPAHVAVAKKSTETKKRDLPIVVFKCIEGPYQGKTFTLKPSEDEKEPVVLIGRSRGRKFRSYGMSLAKDNEVSTNHGRLEVRSGTIFYVDTHSSNGTFVNGEEIPPDKPTRFAGGDSFVIGAGTFVVEFVFDEA